MTERAKYTTQKKRKEQKFYEKHKLMTHALFRTLVQTIIKEMQTPINGISGHQKNQFF
jgi:hypothetical protein